MVTVITQHKKKERHFFLSSCQKTFRKKNSPDTLRYLEYLGLGTKLLAWKVHCSTATSGGAQPHGIQSDINSIYLSVKLHKEATAYLSNPIHKNMLKKIYIIVYYCCLYFCMCMKGTFFIYDH